MKILITGGSGFIGKNLHEGLKKDFKVFIPSSKELNLLNFYDLQKYIKENKVDVIIHSAVPCGKNICENIVNMQFNVLANSTYVDKIYSLGSGAEYSKNRNIKKIKEDSFGKIIPTDDYGLGKFFCSCLNKKHNNVTTLRIFGVYGKYENYLFKFISNAIVKGLMGIPIVVKQNVVFDYLYIDDLVNIIKRLLVKKNNETDFNITPTESIDLLKITSIINKYLTKKTEITFLNKGLNYEYTGSNKKLLNVFKNYRFTSYEDGIVNLMKYYRKNIDHYDKKKLLEDEYLMHAKIKK